MNKFLAKLAMVGVLLLPIAAYMTLSVKADTVNVDFEGYSTGTVNSQDGWSSTGAAGSGCAVYDHAVTTNTFGYASFGTQSLRISNGVTSGCFSDQTFSKSLANEAGETTAENNSLSGGTRQNHYEAQWDFASTVPGSEQAGLAVVASADRGDGARMTWVQMTDTPTGLAVNFYDYQKEVGDFVLSNVASGLDRTVPHTIKMTIDFVEGPANDKVKIFVNGNVVHVGTTWEDYFRDEELNPTRTVDSILFRTGGTAVPANQGNGFVIDNLIQTSGASTVAPASTEVVTSADLTPNGLNGNWFFYNDENDTINNTLGSFVTGPGTAPLGDGSAQISVNGTQRRNLATYKFGGTPLGEITDLKYSTYNPAAGNGGSGNRSAYLNFNVDFSGADNWQRRLVFVPSNNGTVTQDNWKEWNAIDNGNAMWSYSGSTWPTAPSGPHAGQVGISGSTTRTWNDILADFPGVRVRVSDPWLGLRVGEPYADGYTENIDKFVFGTAAGVTTFNFEPTPPAPDVTVTIVKYLNGTAATSENANSTAFPMHATFPGGEGDYTLSPVGYNNPNPYYATTSNMPSGSDYSTYENLSTLCSESMVHALVGYSIGDTLEEAVLNGSGSNEPSIVYPAFEDLTTSKFVVVWNKTCPTTGSLMVSKATIGGEGTFKFTGNGGLGSFNLTTVSGEASKMFENITPGTYNITEKSVKGWTQTDSDCTAVVVTAGEIASCTITNTKNKLLGEIRGRKFQDFNGDGVLGAKDHYVMPNVKFYLDTNDNGMLDNGEVSTTTNAAGVYRFKNLKAGTYIVREVVKPEFVNTYPVNGKYVVTLTAGQIAKKKDFANYKYATISGIKYNDLDGDGKKDSNEPGLAGWTIELTKPNATVVTTTTDANGRYSFTNLLSGQYMVREVQQLGWTQTSSNPGTVNIYSAAIVRNIHFGNKQTEVLAE